MDRLPNPVDFAVPFFILLIVAEMIIVRKKFGARYEPRDTLTSLLFGVGSTVAGLLFAGATIAIAVWLYDHRIATIPYA